MEKLIELLNEYTGKERVLDSDMGEDWFFLKGNCLIQIRDERLISKRYEFIERLVDNDKIDNSKLDNNSDFFQIYRCFEPGRGKKGYEVLIMLLSIQDQPIQFLCELLK